jgi:CheY-like chemotaxis protein
VLLVIEDDDIFAQNLLRAAHANDFKVVVAGRGDAGVALARRLDVSAITLDLHLPDSDGWVVLDQLKHDLATRHIPVHIISALTGVRQTALAMGAIGCLEKPATPHALEAALAGIRRFLEEQVKSLLVVEDDDVARRSLVELLGGPDVAITSVGTGEDALAALAQKKFHCMVLDLGLPDMLGLDLVQRIKNQPENADLPIVIHTGQALTKKEETLLRRLAETVIVKDVASSERLLDETTLHLHRAKASIPAAQRKMLEALHKGSTLTGTTVMVVDDDVRNIFAVTSALERQQANVLFAESGRDALTLLEEHPGVDVVLMDIMMPEMDGYEVMRRIRGVAQWRSLPIIALTAKAMATDRDKCIQAGASDYIAKPVDMTKLVSMIRVCTTRDKDGAA